MELFRSLPIRKLEPQLADRISHATKAWTWWKSAEGGFVRRHEWSALNPYAGVAWYLRPVNFALLSVTVTALVGFIFLDFPPVFGQSSLSELLEVGCVLVLVGLFCLAAARINQTMPRRSLPNVVKALGGTEYEHRYAEVLDRLWWTRQLSQTDKEALRERLNRAVAHSRMVFGPDGEGVRFLGEVESALDSQDWNRLMRLKSGLASPPAPTGSGFLSAAIEAPEVVAAGKE